MRSFDLNAPPSLPHVRDRRTVVLVRFAVIGDRTRVKLHHAGWGDPDGVDDVESDAAYRYFDRAWRSVLDSLARRFAAAGEPRNGSA